MKTIEIAVPSGQQLSAWLSEMRVWLDERRFEPSQFLYDTTREGVVVFVDFKVSAEAEAFARQFGGRASDSPVMGVAGSGNQSSGARVL